MTGKSHKAVGMALGIGIAVWGIKYDANPIYAVAPLITSAGAMIPDIDHDHSKLGRQRKAVQSVAFNVTFVILLGLLGLAIWSMYSQNQWKSLAILIPTVIIPFIAVGILSKTDAAKKIIRFSTKHRGIMHTFLIPLLILAPVKFYDNHMLEIVLVCLALGYLSHIVTDCMTRTGCPVLFPLTMQNISVLPIKSGTVWEYVGCGAVIAAVAWYSFTLM